MIAAAEALLKGSESSKPDLSPAPLPAHLAHDEDLHLMQRVKAGDDEAFNELMRRHEKTVVNLIYRFTGSRAAAEDLAQEVFLRIYRAAGRFEARAKFFTYLYKVTLNLCRNARAKASRRKTTSLDQPRRGKGEGEMPSLDLEDPDGSAEDRVARLEMGEMVREAVDQLPEEQRVVVVLQRFEHLSYEEISEVLGLSVPAVKSRLHRAKLNLKKLLGPYLENTN